MIALVIVTLAALALSRAGRPAEYAVGLDGTRARNPTAKWSRRDEDLKARVESLEERVESVVMAARRAEVW